jgi:hypothetical protein
MLLIPLRENLPKKYFQSECLTIECSSGNSMSAKMHELSRWCKSQKSDSVVVWNSSHHKLHIWFEEPKYKTWYELSRL